MNYDAETNILSLELNKKTKISHALELGNLIIHISAKNTPVLIEVLNASKIIGKFQKIKTPQFKKILKENLAGQILPFQKD